MFSALGSMMECRGHADDSQDQLQADAKKRLQAFFAKFADETSFLEYFKREWESKMGEKLHHKHASMHAELKDRLY